MNMYFNLPNKKQTNRKIGDIEWYYDIPPME